MKRNILIFDPIGYMGGSKIATLEMLQVGQNQPMHFYIISANPDNWREQGNNCTIFKLPTMAFLISEQGWKYWAMQGFYLLMLMIIALRLPKIHQLMGISGPGVDMPLYLYKSLFDTPIVQVIHGNVARSRSIGYCLSIAEKVFYLPCTKKSLFGALCRYYEKQPNIRSNSEMAQALFERHNFIAFTNGLSQEKWPTPCNPNGSKLFWAASLLKWKGLDLFVEALKIQPQDLHAHICYIQPQQTQLPVSEPDRSLPYSHWYQQPSNLDEIRARCSIFVSTSHNEPFGLSILEALAAGMAVIIPDDGAFWAEKLVDGEHCLKYQPNSARDLRLKIERLLASPATRKRLSQNAKNLARLYRSELCYKAIVESLSQTNPIKASASKEIHRVKTSEKGAL
ncbi:glycosyltransferase family 4 protein [Vibrio sp. 05-20-BW147]|uniref:glycosyltransferase family 4 protein n=1 Tax=Vibrio sp. 05-20-BW147 TaxID=2575834 RepID=UPI001594A870|nr:glycosyltransferase family 4 protein [Vibrio sp. 05-20-BW147]NVC63867.1 glycosyltransferase family 4 protein [Vibrio sp. 05-20-BW147]